MLELNKIYQGDCLEVLKDIDDNLIDAVITDPPYELGFMGKIWDSTGIANNVEVWKSCLRVLKPGGYLLSFGGTRTYHRMACAIEDAGFEIRDMIEWIYGSGFPKSLDISKAIDKMAGAERKVTGRYTDPNGIEYKQTGNRRNFTSGNVNETEICDDKRFLLTAPSTPSAIQWQGWGTALKPAHEVIAMAQKPFTSVPFYDILTLLIIVLWRQICQLPSYAKIVERNLKLSQQEPKEVLDTAQWIAENNINIQDILSVLMDTLQSELEINSNWNIVLSWLNILQDLWKSMSKFTTSMEIGLITELKILKSLQWQDIFQNITQTSNKMTDGFNANVLTADVIFNVVKLKLIDILTLFAQENAILQGEQKDLHHNGICMARKPLSEKSVAENVLKYGTGGINIDGCRVKFDSENEVNLRPNAVNHKFGNRNDESHLGKMRSDMGNNGADKRDLGFHNSQGRFPANLIHDGSDEVMAEFEKYGNINNSYRPSGSRIGKGNNTFTKQGTIETENAYGYNDSGTPARFFYCAKASKSERDMGCKGLGEKIGLAESNRKIDGKSILGNKPNSELRMGKNNHPTVKPIKLMEYLIKLVTTENAIVLDPFTGSGSTLIACRNLGRNYIGIEKEADYVEIADKRIEEFKQQLVLV